MSTKDIAKLDATALGQLLVDTTISASKEVDPQQGALIFAEYARRALPDLQLAKLRINNTAAALNSISALAERETDKGVQPVFLKVHVESGQIGSSSSALGAKDEYRNGRLLADSGWPTVIPIMESSNEQYPLLIYEAFTADQRDLFDLIEGSYARRDTSDLEAVLPELSKFNQIVGEAQVSSLAVRDSIDLSRAATLQVFFGRRLDPGARADQWFTPDRLFKLPGIESPMSWADLQGKSWVINGEEYDVTLEKVLAEARKELLFSDQGDRKSYLVVAHGDDHPGNIIAGVSPGSTKVFDPVAAGLAPASMANAKALAHATILPMAGMYYDPKCKNAQYRTDGSQMVVDYDFASTPVFEVHEAIARQAINSRIMPVFRAMRAAGADISREFATLKSALAMCALLTVDTTMLLAKGDDRGIGLLPATIMLSQSAGLPGLEYLTQEIGKM